MPKIGQFDRINTLQATSAERRKIGTPFCEHSVVSPSRRALQSEQELIEDPPHFMASKITNVGTFKSISLFENIGGEGDEDLRTLKKFPVSQQVADLRHYTRQIVARKKGSRISVSHPTALLDHKSYQSALLGHERFTH